MTRSKCRSIIIVAVGCIGKTGHVFLEIAIAIIIFQRIYESFRRPNVTSGPWKRKWENYLKTAFIWRHADHACVPKQGNEGQVCVPNWASGIWILSSVYFLLFFLWPPVKNNVRSSVLRKVKNQNLSRSFTYVSELAGRISSDELLLSKLIILSEQGQSTMSLPIASATCRVWLKRWFFCTIRKRCAPARPYDVDRTQRGLRRHISFLCFFNGTWFSKIGLLVMPV